MAANWLEEKSKYLSPMQYTSIIYFASWILGLFTPVMGGKWPFEFGLWCSEFQLSSAGCWDIFITIFSTLILPKYLINSGELPCKSSYTLFMIGYACLHQSVNDTHKYLSMPKNRYLSLWTHSTFQYGYEFPFSLCKSYTKSICTTSLTFPTFCVCKLLVGHAPYSNSVRSIE